MMRSTEDILQELLDVSELKESGDYWSEPLRASGYRARQMPDGSVEFRSIHEGGIGIPGAGGGATSQRQVLVLRDGKVTPKWETSAELAQHPITHLGELRRLHHVENAGSPPPPTNVKALQDARVQKAFDRTRQVFSHYDSTRRSKPLALPMSYDASKNTPWQGTPWVMPTTLSEVEARAQHPDSNLEEYARYLQQRIDNPVPGGHMTPGDVALELQKSQLALDLVNQYLPRTQIR